LITGAEQLIDEEILNLKNSPRFEVQIAREGQLVTESLSINTEDILMNYNEEGFTLVYPRFEIKNLSLKTSTDDLKIQITDVSGVLKSLEKYVDYSVLLRQDADV
jgi:hypothetical protein